jgi:tetratricopeptide (TPR) repeat protein
MAPEQAGGHSQTVGPATDVHALGAILYELLTGRPPFRGDGAVETLLQVRTQEPLAPSRLRPGVPRDLETICLKCLHKDRGQRYASAQALADDLQRYLSRQPIQARRVGVLGRIVLWCQRKPALATTIAVAVVAVLTVASLSFVQVLQERERYRSERDRARANLRQACQAVDQMLTRVGAERLVRVPQLLTVRRDLFEDAVRFYEELARQEPDDIEVRFELGRAYRRLGEMYHDAFSEKERAERNIRKALVLAEQLAEEFPAEAAYERERANCYRSLGYSLSGAGRRVEAEAVLRQAIALREKLVRAHPEVADYLVDWASTLDALGVHLGTTGRIDEAAPFFQQAVTLMERLAAENHAGLECRPRLAGFLYNLGFYLVLTQRLEEAAKVYDRVHDLWQALANDDPGEPAYQGRLALILSEKGKLRVKQGRAEQGEALLRRSWEMRKQLIADNPDMPYARHRLGAMLYELALLVRARGAAVEACQLWELAIAEQRESRKAELFQDDVRKELYLSYEQLAETRLQLGEHRLAARATAELPPFEPVGLPSHYRAAVLLVRCATLATKDASVAENQRQVLVKEYADRAVELLAQAIHKGEKELPSLRTDPALDILRPRPNFQRLLANVEAGEAKKN